MQGNAITKDLINRINAEHVDLIGIDIIVSFIKSSGFEQIKAILAHAKKEKIPVRVLTSTYMNVTDPIALSKLNEVLGEGCVKLYNGQAPSFHPKAYFFKCGNNRDSYLLVGSSNISKPALTNGIEWNYKVNNAEDSMAYEYYLEQFDYLYKYQSYVMTESHIKEYRDSMVVPEEERKKQRINVHYNKYKQKSYIDRSSKKNSLFMPHQAQEEALFELNRTRKNGNSKALVIAATGIGKTFLAAFDSESFEKVLFIAHREEILNQSYDTFAKVRESIDFGRYYKDDRETDKKIIFASVQTLSRREHMLKFAPDAFDYIIVDEFHHASAPSYNKIVDYFKPKFMLGLTATPHRLDKKDVFQICDYNVPYEVSLFSAINRDWLVPFAYYGIHDDTIKYDNVRFINGRYVNKELSKALSIEKRADLIYRHYIKHKRGSTIGFCVDINHAEQMAGYFKKKGICASTIHSDNSRKHTEVRHIALQKLAEGNIEVIFAVDMLNEGVDIPRIDMLLFLRPTESPTVFLQQLGRGLRHHEGKLNLKVLDFIGNYRNVEMLPFWLSGRTADTTKGKRQIIKDLVDHKGIPSECFIDFDLEVVDIFEKMIKSKIKIDQRIEELYSECKMMVGHVPSRMEFFEHLDESNYKSMKYGGGGKYNPFKNYLEYISHVESNYIPDGYMTSEAYKFVKMIETTVMNKLYKIPILKSFVGTDKINSIAGRERISKEFMLFYQNERHFPDIANDKGAKKFREWGLDKYWSIAKKNPINFFCKTSGEVFEFDDEKNQLIIKYDLIRWCEDEFFINQVKDAIEFRRAEFVDSRLN